jgi:hypothetical protein
VTKKNKYRENFAAAKAELSRYGRPSAPNIAKYVTMKRRGNNTTAYVNTFRMKTADKRK